MGKVCLMLTTLGRVLLHHERDALSVHLRYSDVGLLIASLIQFAAHETTLFLQLKHAVWLTVAISIESSTACAIICDQAPEAHLEIARLQSRLLLNKFLSLHSGQIRFLVDENRSNLKFMEKAYTLSAALVIEDPDACTMEPFLNFQHECVSDAIEVTTSCLRQIQEQSGFVWDVVNAETNEFVLQPLTKWPPSHAVRHLIQHCARCLSRCSRSSLILQVPRSSTRVEALSFYLRVIPQTSFVWVAELSTAQRQHHFGLQDCHMHEPASDLQRLLHTSTTSVSYEVVTPVETPPDIEFAYTRFIQSLALDR